MNNKAKKFFSDQESARIASVIKDVETRTVGEIVVMVVDSSDRYIDAEILGGVVLGGIGALILTAVFLHSSMWYFLVLALLLYAAASFIVGNVPRLKKIFMLKSRIEHEVHERALSAFYEKGLYKTREHTGVLFFISLLEKKIWVLADEGINSRISSDVLNGYVKNLSQGIKGNRACDALCESIEHAGSLLSQHFPYRKGDTDELSNEVIQEK